jgi:hypothetical protein
MVFMAVTAVEHKNNVKQIITLEGGGGGMHKNNVKHIITLVRGRGDADSVHC